MLIKPGIDSSGYRTAVRDYTEPIVVEELAANCYDADSTTCLILLDTVKGNLHIIDDGLGFPEDAIQRIAILGAGSKQAIPYSKGQRHYLGSYGYGLKSSLNISDKVTIHSISDDGEFTGAIDWAKLDEALRTDFTGFEFTHNRLKRRKHTGTHVTLFLKNPTSKEQLDLFAGHLSNLPTDGGKFSCYVGIYADVLHRAPTLTDKFEKLRRTAETLAKKGTIILAESSRQADLDSCEQEDLQDKDDKTIRAKFFFSGIEQGKVRPLKRGLRGIYVRIHGRLLKQSFTESKFTYNISRWKKFESGLRVELTVDWLRDQISLSREGVRFSNPKLEEDFKSLLQRCIGRFIQPRLRKLEQKAARAAARKSEQRLELAKKRVKRDRSIMVTGLNDGFPFRPETDGELVLVLAQSSVLKAVNKSLSIIDYNDKATFDCVLYDKAARNFVNTELEPTLIEWLGHKDTTDVDLIITWSLGKWRTGAKKKGSSGWFKLVADKSKKPGYYKLLHYATSQSKTPRRDYPVIALDEVLRK